MNRVETLKIMSLLKAGYLQQFKNMQKSDAESMVNLWNMKFSDVAYDLVFNAVSQIIDRSKFFPTIAEVKEIIADITYDNESAFLEQCTQRYELPPTALTEGVV